MISEIVVEGAQRIEPATVRSYLQVREGQPFDDLVIDLSLKSLFNTGFFADVTFRREGDRLIVAVVENPIINRVAFEGNRAIDDDDLEKEVQLKPRTIFTRAKVQSDLQRIIEVYRRSGRFGATVDPKIIQLPQNRVDLVFEIAEGEATGVARINFVGNRVFSDSELREQIATTESAWWRFLTSNDNYDPDRLTFDREQLRRFYLTRGYADFRVISAVAELTPDRTEFFITFTVEEGEQYAFGDVTVETQLAQLQPEELEGALRPVPGDVYNAELVDKSIEDINFAAGSRGYAFVDVRPMVRRDPDERTIDVVFQVNEGPRVYIDRIDIVGNTRTLDKVIRREFRVAEGDAFNRVLINRSRTRIRALGFFKEVEIKEAPSAQPDRVGLTVEVEEQPTGEFSIGFGFSSSDNFLADFGFTERNLLGRGQFLRLRLQLSSTRQQLDFRFTEPYFLDRNLAFGVEAYKLLTDFDEAAYRTDSTGVGLRVGFPLSEFSRLTLRYLFRIDEIEADAGAPIQILLSQGTATSSLVGYTYSLNTLDDPLKPTQGVSFTFDQEIAGLGGDLRYIRSDVDATVFSQLFFEDVIGSVRMTAGWITGWGGEDIRINERYFKGGASFRGFAPAGVGPRELVTDAALGGEIYAIGSVDIRFPNPFPEEYGIRTGLFTDFGTVGMISGLDTTCTLFSCSRDDLSLRMSAGLTVQWDSPFGPVQFDLGQAFLKEDYDETQVFRFSTATRF